MWQLYYIRALEIHEERLKEAEQVRLARLEADPLLPRRSRVTILRRNAAGMAVWIARRIDPGAAREAARRHPRKVGSV